MPVIYIIYKIISAQYHNDIDLSGINYDILDGHQFEHFCADILKRNGYKNVSVTQGSGDNGVDIVAWKNNRKYVVQCKCYSSNIGNKAVQEVYTGKQMYHADVAVVMTNRYFTKNAIKTAKETHVILWDRDTLNRFIHKTSKLLEDSSATNSVEKPDDKRKEMAVEIEDIENNHFKNKKSDNILEAKENKNMYDKEKGIFPSGTYEVGDDIEAGKYLLTSKKDVLGEISVYPSYEDYKNDTNIMTYNSFDGEYHLSLRENGLFISLENAEMRKL